MISNPIKVFRKSASRFEIETGWKPVGNQLSDGCLGVDRDRMDFAIKTSKEMAPSPIEVFEHQHLNMNMKIVENWFETCCWMGMAIIPMTAAYLYNFLFAF